MHLDPLLLPANHLAPRQSGPCIACPAPPPCNCPASQDCVQINRDCYTCSSFQCVARTTSSPSSGDSGGVSKGALAGAIVGSLLVLTGAIALLIWYHRRLRARKGVPTREVKADTPAPAETVLNRPDPTEKSTPPPTINNSVRVYSTRSDTTIDLDPESRGPSAASSPLTSGNRSSTQSNPFGDGHSIQTTSTGTQATNVIPIALVPPGSVSSISADSQGETTASTAPQRPARSPELNLNLDHVNVSRDEIRALAPYNHSVRSGVSMASSRNSYMSGASYSSEFMEAPIIVTPTQGAVRQVLGVHKAEMLQAPGSLPSTPMTSGSLQQPPSLASRPSIRSPLAATSFTPADAVMEADIAVPQDLSIPGDPFEDRYSKPSPSASMATFGTASSRPGDSDSNIGDSEAEPRLPWAQPSDTSSRPSSLNTQAGSLIDIGNATRVNVGLTNQVFDGAFSDRLTPRTPYRTTMGRLVTPSSSKDGTLEEQQQRALAHAQAQAQAQGLDRGRRVSGSSVVSATSTRADSILESFPFVPPSPISDRPIRSPPRSPLAQQAFASGSPLKDTGHRPSMQAAAAPKSPTLPPLIPPNRKFLGLSTASQSSSASSGLGSFPFQIDSGNGSDAGHGPPPTSFSAPGTQSRQRASLDTLALTSDLSSYPLGFDRDSQDNFPFKG